MTNTPLAREDNQWGECRDFDQREEVILMKNKTNIDQNDNSIIALRMMYNQ